MFTPDERTDQLYTAYAQDDISLVPDKLSFTAGAKLLHSSFTDLDVEPSVRLLWTPTARQSVAAVTRAVRTPSDIEDNIQNTSLVSTDPLAFSITKGDGRFTSETLIGYEAGYRSVISKTVFLGHRGVLQTATTICRASNQRALLLRKIFRGHRHCFTRTLTGTD